MLRVLCQEWAIVQEISTSEAMAEISLLLERNDSTPDRIA
jgi:hypothetical protein